MTDPKPDSPLAPRYLLLGKLLRPHGVRGEIRMHVLTDYPERISELEELYLSADAEGADAKPYHVEHMRMHQGVGLLKLREIEDRDMAERMRDLYALVPIEDAVPLEEGEYYLYQLIGVRVQTEDGAELGTLREVLETGANDVYIVDSPAHGEVLIPVTPDTILKTDIEARLMTVRLPEGLLPS